VAARLLTKMSASTDALAAALADQISEHGQEFTVDGEEDAIVGIIEDNPLGLANGMAGMELASEISVTIPRAAWTPTMHAVITFQGETYTVDRISGKVPHQWRFTAVNRAQ
jgi:hypothetical protein